MSAITIQTVGDWKSEVGVPLNTAIRTAMAVMGRTSEQATKQAIILMAQSARKLTPQAKKTRPVFDNPNFKYLLTDEQYAEYRKSGKDLEPHFRFMAMRWTQREGALPIFANDKADLRSVPRTGLAKASWFWGLRKLGASGSSKYRDVKGVVTAGASRTKTGEIGHYMNNALSYIMRILPPGWERTVERLAGNKMMAQARKRLEQDYARSLRRASAGGARLTGAVGRLLR